jgi:hypothetical protein|tara:strand:+ start:463 stop:639 length:177 start_codon:yes stop_codon:yes gene_type:complete
MTHKLVDLYIDKVIGEYDSSEGAQKALSRLYPEAGRYEIQSPKARKPRAKKNVKEESD